MENEKEIEELKKRIVSLEKQVQRRNQSSNKWRFALTFIIVFVAILISIGIFQFVTPAN